MKVVDELSLWAYNKGYLKQEEIVHLVKNRFLPEYCAVSHKYKFQVTSTAYEMEFYAEDPWTFIGGHAKRQHSVRVPTGMMINKIVLEGFIRSNQSAVAMLGNKSSELVRAATKFMEFEFHKEKIQRLTYDPSKYSYQRHSREPNLYLIQLAFLFKTQCSKVRNYK